MNQKSNEHINTNKKWLAQIERWISTNKYKVERSTNKKKRITNSIRAQNKNRQKLNQRKFKIFKSKKIQTRRRPDALFREQIINEVEHLLLGLTILETQRASSRNVRIILVDCESAADRRARPILLVWVDRSTRRRGKRREGRSVDRTWHDPLASPPPLNLWVDTKEKMQSWWEDKIRSW